MEKFNAIEYLMNFGKSGKPVTDLSRIKKLLELLDNPQKNLKFIHIAGTNGKGSVLEEISYCLMKNNLKTGQFTSPFIRRYNDRIRINGKEIPNEKLDVYCEKISKLHITNECSQFEITFAAALLWFSEEKCDVCVLETGIGGLLDATNIIEKPLLSVITSVSMDHMALLGDTIEKITRQKAGIIKQNSACVTDAFNCAKTIEIIKKECINKNAKFIIPDKSECRLTKAYSDGTEFIYKNKKYKTAMAGIHQMHNSILFIKAMEYLKKYFDITEKSISDSISNAKVEGRIQLIKKSPCIYLDGGHNEDGAEALCSFIENTKPEKPVTAVTGMIKTKDYKTVCEKFSKVFDKIICTDGFTYNAVEKEKLAELFDSEKVSVMDIDNACKWVNSQEKGTYFFCGSLYLVSRILDIKDNISENSNAKV